MLLSEYAFPAAMDIQFRKDNLSRCIAHLFETRPDDDVLPSLSLFEGKRQDLPAMGHLTLALTASPRSRVGKELIGIARIYHEMQGALGKGYNDHPGYLYAARTLERYNIPLTAPRSTPAPRSRS